MARSCSTCWSTTRATASSAGRGCAAWWRAPSPTRPRSSRDAGGGGPRARGARHRGRPRCGGGARARRWLPRALRRDLLALYGFARLVDQLGDDVAGNREALLDALEDELALAFDGRARTPLLAEVGRVANERGLPRGPFLRLVEANRRDQRVATTATWSELEDYCRLSANPVGELVLALFGLATPERIAWSDAICTALQVVEHCQDVREDKGRGRIYLPADERRAFGVREEDLATAPAPEPLRRLLAFEAERARSLLRAGEPLLATLP